jgi:transcriptional regulator with XRE-family HTH domain
MTQTKLAKKVGIKREYINRIINSKVTPTVPLGMRIAHMKPDVGVLSQRYKNKLGPKMTRKELIRLICKEAWNDG